jgi:hypothetical protein
VPAWRTLEGSVTECPGAETGIVPPASVPHGSALSFRARIRLSSLTNMGRRRWDTHVGTEGSRGGVNRPFSGADSIEPAALLGMHRDAEGCGGVRRDGLVDWWNRGARIALRIWTSSRCCQWGLSLIAFVARRLGPGWFRGGGRASHPPEPQGSEGSEGWRPQGFGSF